MSKGKRKGMPFQLGKAIINIFKLILGVLFWVFLHEDGYLAGLKVIMWGLVILLVGLFILLFTHDFPTASERYEFTYNECLVIETLTESQCHDIALESID